MTRMESSRINFESFDILVEDWMSYMEWFELYLVMNEVEETEKAQPILSLMGATTYKLKNLAIPEVPSKMKYEDIIKLLKENFESEAVGDN